MCQGRLKRWSSHTIRSVLYVWCFPFLPQAVLSLHHKVHHQAYVTKLNAAVQSIQSVAHDLVPSDPLHAMAKVHYIVRSVLLT